MSDNESTTTWQALHDHMLPFEYAPKPSLHLALTDANCFVVGDVENIERYRCSTWRDSVEKHAIQWFGDRGYNPALLAIHFVCIYLLSPSFSLQLDLSMTSDLF